MSHVFDSGESTTPVAESPKPGKEAAIDTPKELSPLLYRDTEHKPYAAKYFEMETVYADLDGDLLGHIDTVDDYYEELSKKGEFENSKVGYAEFIKKYERITDTKYADKRVKLAAISSFIKYLQKRASYES